MSFVSTIFLTGFPGFIAGRLVERLADRDTHFYLLVQPKFVGSAAESIAKVAASTGVPAANFEIVEGDITLRDLSLNKTDLAVVRAETTDVFHLAAVYDLSVEKDLAQRVNVEGTQNVNELVKHMPSLRRYNYISTCYVAGRRPGHILENELEHSSGFRNFYEETKYLAEIEVAKLRDELPLTIFRPSVVVGDSLTGETAKYDGIYSVILFLRKFPALFGLVNVGNSKVRLNLVPVDFVVEGIAALSRDEKALGKTIALADPNPMTTAEIFDSIAEALVGRKSAVVPPASFVQLVLSLPFSPLVTGLPSEGVPYFFLEQTYDTGVACELLAPHKVFCPNFADYAKNIVRYVQENPPE